MDRLDPALQEARMDWIKRNNAQFPPSFYDATVSVDLDIFEILMLETVTSHLVTSGTMHGTAVLKDMAKRFDQIIEYEAERRWPGGDVEGMKRQRAQERAALFGENL
jgi:hypothetical protein